MVKINGKNENAQGLSAAEYLKREGYDVRRVAVEKNGEIVPRAQYETTFFREGDKVEIASFVGGG